MNLSNLSSTKTILDTDRETKHMRLGVLYDRYEPPLSSLQTYDVEVVPVDANDLVSPAQLRGVEALYLYAWGEGVRNFHKILPGLIDLRWIHVANVGVEDVLTPYLRESAITVTNSRGVFDQAIAEYVLGAILYGIKDMQTTIDDQRSMRWHRRNTRSLRGSKIVIFGAGSIGKRTADILMGLGVEVIMIGHRHGT